MENLSDLDQMKKFDFNAPFTVTLIIDDSDDDNPILKKQISVRKDQENAMDVNTNIEAPVETQECLTEHILSSENLNINSDTSISATYQNNSINKRTQMVNEINSDSFINSEDVERYTNNAVYRRGEYSETIEHSLLARNATGEKTGNHQHNTEITQQIENNEPRIFIEDLLNRLSDHLIFIMQSFYHYGIKKAACSSPVDAQGYCKREKVFNFIKFHFYELSYNTMVSVILPHEQNHNFIHNFLSKTVHKANKKSMRWKCKIRHVQPFFKDLVAWAKLKREVIKKKTIQQQSNENVILKQQLNMPLLRPDNPSQCIDTLKTNTPTNVCIFSSGTPGNEISINIDADTLISCTEKSYVTPEWTGTQNHVVSGESAPKHKSAPPPYNYINGNRRNTANYYRPPPPYNTGQVSQNNNFPNQNIANRMQCYPNMREPHENTRILEQPNQYYQAPFRPNINIHPSNISYLDYNNPIMHQTQAEWVPRQANTNLISLNPNRNVRISVRCCMCGKNTSSTCDPYTPCRPVYCGYLCQELDGQIRQAACT